MANWHHKLSMTGRLTSIGFSKARAEGSLPTQHLAQRSFTWLKTMSFILMRGHPSGIWGDMEGWRGHDRDTSFLCVPLNPHILAMYAPIFCVPSDLHDISPMFPSLPMSSVPSRPMSPHIPTPSRCHFPPVSPVPHLYHPSSHACCVPPCSLYLPMCSQCHCSPCPLMPLLHIPSHPPRPLMPLHISAVCAPMIPSSPYPLHLITSLTCSPRLPSSPHDPPVYFHPLSGSLLIEYRVVLALTAASPSGCPLLCSCLSQTLGIRDFSLPRQPVPSLVLQRARTHAFPGMTGNAEFCIMLLVPLHFFTSQTGCTLLSLKSC